MIDEFQFSKKSKPFEDPINLLLGGNDSIPANEFLMKIFENEKVIFAHIQIEFFAFIVNLKNKIFTYFTPNTFHYQLCHF